MLLDRIAERIELVDHPDFPGCPCWLYQGEINRNGYGRVYTNGKRRVVHRVLWCEVVGSILDAHVLDHLCRRRSCCNPDHLEPVTHQVNTLRGVAVLFTARPAA